MKSTTHLKYVYNYFRIFKYFQRRIYSHRTENQRAAVPPTSNAASRSPWRCPTRCYRHATARGKSWAAPWLSRATSPSCWPMPSAGGPTPSRTLRRPASSATLSQSPPRRFTRSRTCYRSACSRQRRPQRHATIRCPNPRRFWPPFCAILSSFPAPIIAIHSTTRRATAKSIKIEATIL